MEEKKNPQRSKRIRWILAAVACCAIVAGICMAGIVKSDGDKVEDAQGKNPVETAEIGTAKNYDEIYACIEETNRQQEAASKGSETGVMMESVEDSSSAAENSGSSAYAGAGYSDTNIRTAGVEEGDIVKTDGTYLYVLNGYQIHIVDIRGGEPKAVGLVDLEDQVYVSEIYVSGDRLVVCYTRTETETEESAGSSYGSAYREYAVAETFDISEPEHPVSVGCISQSGTYSTMRAADGYVYLLSRYYPATDCTAKNVAEYIPAVQGNLLDSRDIFMPALKTASQYTVITAFSLEEPDARTDTKAVFGTGGTCYVSGANIYICENDYGYGDSDTEVTRTWIRKVAYKEGELAAVGQVKVDGTLNDSFSIDEYEGNLRLVTTVSHVGNNGVMPIGGVRFSSTEEEETEKQEDTNTLYILDRQLQELSRIEGLAEDEQVYSARFMGDTGYFVTYRQIDPLFSADLSDPEHPKIMGELKIPGFSEYLHPYGEGQLLGIGMDTDTTGTTTDGVKVSMFDIRDPEHVEETQKYVIEGAYSTDVTYNYKAAFIDAEKNMIGFVAYGDRTRYYIFSYGENGFAQEFTREMTGMFSEVRALYAGENLYLVAGNTVEAYRLDTFEKTGDIVL